MIVGNKFNHKLDAQCFDFAFLNIVSSLQTLDLSKNQIECTNNFMVIQTHPNLVWLSLEGNKISSLDLNAFQGTNLTHINLSNNYKLTSLQLNDDGTPSQLLTQQCLDFNSFNNMKQLQSLQLANNQIQCIINFESIQQHTQLEELHLENNHLLSSIDFTKFDKSKPLMNSLQWVYFNNMNLMYTRQNNDCLDLQFLKFMPNVKMLHLSDNKIQCIDNLSILQRQDVKLEYLYLENINLLSFDFADLINSNISEIYLQDNNLSSKSLKNLDFYTLSRINPSNKLKIGIEDGNHVKLPRTTLPRVRIF